MGSALQCYIYECPDDQVRAALDVLDQHGVGEDFADPTPRLSLVLGAPGYGRHDMYGEASVELAADLHEKAPGALFHTWTDPAEDYLGCGVIAGPGGEYRFESSAQGEPLFTAREVKDAMDAGTVDQLLGGDLVQAADDAATRVRDLPEKERRVRVPVCAECKTRTRCTCEEDLEDEAHDLHRSWGWLLANATA